MKILIVLLLFSLNLFSCDITTDEGLYKSWINRVAGDSLISEKILVLNADGTYSLTHYSDSNEKYVEVGAFNAEVQLIRENEYPVMTFIPADEEIISYTRVFDLSHKGNLLTLIDATVEGSYPRTEYRAMVVAVEGEE